MGFSTHLNLIRSLLLRLHAFSKRKRRLSSRRRVSCVGRFRSLSIPTLSSLRSWREELPEQRRRRRRRRKNEDQQSFGIDEVFVSPEGIPSEEEEFASFTAMHPGYLETLVVDELRDEEYGELQQDGHVCLDYSGHGLFSQLQQELDSSSSSFAISHISGDLSTQAFYVEPDEGTVESDIRRRVMRFLNIQEGEYGMVFTVSKGAAFKLLAESYPFNAQRSLLTMFDYESEAVGSMEETVRRHGVQTLNASFHFPSLTVCSADLKSQILYKHLEEKDKKKGMDTDVVENRGGKSSKKKIEEFGKMERTKEESKGLFVFPVQSRVSGTRYSYQWMSLAQDNGWHVLLDASALGPKDMDSLGLSLFRPDFIVTSFYKVFGSDPTGFGCLFVKNSSMSILCPSTAARNVGMVRLIPLTDVLSPNNPLREEYADTFSEKKSKIFPYKTSSKAEIGQAEIAFSGPASTFFKWRQAGSAYNAIKIGDRLEESAEENGDTALLKKNVILGNFDNYVENKGRAVEIDAVNLEKGKTPITPRSVLEESLLEGPDHSHDGESHELDGCSSSGLAMQEEKVCCPGDTFLKGSDVISLHTRNSQNVLDRRRFLASHSHEIARRGVISTGQGAFSQPLISRDAQGNPFFVHSEGSSYYVGSQDELEFSSSLYEEDEESSSEFDNSDDESIVRREPEIYCRGLNHADTLGLNKTNDRLRFLTNWLISSMSKLQHLVSNKFEPLVHLYGPKVKYDRGASLAFNLCDCEGEIIKPAFVQQLADRNNISLGLGALSHIRFSETIAKLQDCRDSTDELSILTQSESPTGFPVVTAALGFFTNFEDVYKLWAFVAKFLDAEFVKHELCTIH